MRLLCLLVVGAAITNSNAWAQEAGEKPATGVDTQADLDHARKLLGGA